MSDTGCNALVKALIASEAPLDDLTLRFNLIGDEGAISLARLVKKCKTLRTLLDLHLNYALIAPSLRPHYALVAPS